MLYEVEVLQSDCQRIGDPVPLPLTDIVSNNPTTDRSGKRVKCVLEIIIIESI